MTSLSMKTPIRVFEDSTSQQENLKRSPTTPLSPTTNRNNIIRRKLDPSSVGLKQNKLVENTLLNPSLVLKTTTVATVVSQHNSPIHNNNNDADIYQDLHESDTPIGKTIMATTIGKEQLKQHWILNKRYQKVKANMEFLEIERDIEIEFRSIQHS